MNATQRLVAFGAGLVAVVALGAGLGAAVGPDAVTAATEAPAPEGEGVVAARDGYRLVPASTTLDPAGGPFRFVISAPDGEPQHAFTPIHERNLHLVVVNRELTSFEHVHPRLAADGTWSVDLPALAAGSYRAVADFQVDDGPRLAWWPFGRATWPTPTCTRWMRPRVRPTTEPSASTPRSARPAGTRSSSTSGTPVPCTRRRSPSTGAPSPAPLTWSTDHR